MHTLFVPPCLMCFLGRACEGSPSPGVTPAEGSCIPPEPVTDTEETAEEQGELAEIPPSRGAEPGECRIPDLPPERCKENLQ